MHTALFVGQHEAVHLLSLEQADAARRAVQSGCIYHNQLIGVFDGTGQGEAESSAVEQLHIIEKWGVFFQLADDMHPYPLVSERRIAESQH